MELSLLLHACVLSRSQHKREYIGLHISNQRPAFFVVIRIELSSRRAQCGLNTWFRVKVDQISAARAAQVKFFFCPRCTSPKWYYAALCCCDCRILFLAGRIFLEPAGLSLAIAPNYITESALGWCALHYTKPGIITTALSVFNRSINAFCLQTRERLRQRQAFCSACILPFPTTPSILHTFWTLLNCKYK